MGPIAQLGALTDADFGPSLCHAPRWIWHRGLKRVASSEHLVAVGAPSVSISSRGPPRHSRPPKNPTARRWAITRTAAAAIRHDDPI